jgi:putative CocE/NonD family hydrolase
MSIMSRLAARLYKLPPTETYDIAVDKNLEVPMPDGTVLLADHYYPHDLGPRPTVLIRSVYNNRSKARWANALFAERGFHVLVVSGRGVEGSGGEMTPFRQERDDGVAVLTWLKEQEWFNGEVGASGASYLGYTQWAIAHDAGSMLKAMSTQFIGSNFRDLVYPGDAFALELFLWWIALVHAQDKALFGYFATVIMGNRRRRKAAWHLPIVELDQMVTGEQYQFWRDWLEHSQPDDPWWEPGDHSGTVADVTAVNHLVGGWYDFFLPYMLRDYSALQKAGRQPYLTVGPWTHFDGAGSFAGMREGLVWLRAHLLGGRRGLRQAPVRIFVVSADEWRDLPAWPPADMKPQYWYLQPNGGLAVNLSSPSEADHYRYDPSDPTPSVGGAARALGQGRASVDNRALEARPDVLTYTSASLERDVEVIGPVSAELFVRSSLEHTDFFVRLCDVHPDGKSMNVCDGLLRLFPGRPAADSDGCRRVCIDLWPTAYYFKHGHRIRVQVSSGAFPHFARNLGTGEPLATGTAMRVAEQQIYHDPAHPSAIILPVSQAKQQQD